MSYENLLNILVTVRSKTNTQGDTGAVEFTWSDKKTSVKSRRVRNKQPNIYDEIAKTYIDEYKFYFLLEEDVEVSDRIKTADGQEYEILNVSNDSSNHHQKAYCKITKN